MHHNCEECVQTKKKKPVHLPFVAFLSKVETPEGEEVSAEDATDAPEAVTEEVAAV